MVRPAAKREAVAHLRTVFQMSERRACSLIAADRSSVRYRPCRPPDAELRSANPSSHTPARQAGAGRYGQAFLDAIDWALTVDSAARPQTVADLRRALCTDHVASLDLQDALADGDTVIEGDAQLRESRWHRAGQMPRNRRRLKSRVKQWRPSKN